MLARAASFSRRSKRGGDAACSKENHVNEAAKPASVVGKIVRTASFSRRAKSSSSHRDDDDDATNSGDATSRSATPDTERAPDSPPVEPTAAPEPEPPAVLQDALYGWLLKKQATGSGWNRRYFFVDESRGTLAYAKSMRSRGSKPSAVLPIADIARITRDENEPCTFAIACPPIHLTVQAVSAKEAKNWIRQLELRMDVWRARQADKMPIANVQMILRQVSEEQRATAHPALPPFASVPTVSDEASPPLHRPPSPPTAGDGQDSPGAASPVAGAGAASRPAGDAESEARAPPLVPRPAVPEPSMLVSPGRAAHAKDSAAAEHEPDVDLSAGEAEPARVFAPVRTQSELAAMLDVAPTATRSAIRPPAAAPAAVTETVELYSDDEDEGASPGIHSANKASGVKYHGGHDNASPPMRGPAPVPLAAMISSDEDEDAEAELPPAARPKAVRGVARAAVAAPPAVSEPEPPASACDWDSDAESLEAPRDANLVGAAFAPVETVAEALGAPSPSPPPRAPAPPPMVMAAPGIAADTNFAEDDWDDDEDM